MSSAPNRGRAGGTAGPSRPLIARPQFANPQQAQPGGSHSSLSSSIAGALSSLGGRLPAQPATGYARQGGAGWPGAGHTPHLQQSAYAPQHPQQPFPPYGAPYGMPGMAYGASYGAGSAAFPSSHYPPQAYGAYAPGYPYFLPPGQAYGMPQHPSHGLPQTPVASGSQGGARTTADGYTISSAYTAPPPGVSNPSQQQNQQKKKPKGPGAGAEGGESFGGKPAKGGAPANGGPAMVRCQQEGCTFTGNRKSVREHEEDRHLIYAPGREPKPWAGSYAPIDGAQIEGFAISLDSPEAVAKWIEERKKRWPSNKVVEEKEKLYPAQAGRGGRGGRGRGSDRGRGRGGRLSRPNAGAGGIWGEQEPVKDLPAHTSQDGSVEESTAEPAQEVEEPARKKVKLDAIVADKTDGNVAHSDAGSAKADPASSDDDDDDDDDDDGPPVETSSRAPVPSLSSEGEVTQEQEDREQAIAPAGRPTIHPSRLRAAAEEGDKEVSEEADVERSKAARTIVCRYFKQRGKCNQGDACPFLHSLPNGEALPPVLPKRRRPAPPPAPYNPFARADPFAQLAERDWSHIVSDALQAIEFLEGNDWLKGVELRAGQIEEEGGIEVLAESEAKEEELVGGREAGIEELGEEETREEVRVAEEGVEADDDDEVMDLLVKQVGVVVAADEDGPAEVEVEDASAQIA